MIKNEKIIMQIFFDYFDELIKPNHICLNDLFEEIYL